MIPDLHVRSRADIRWRGMLLDEMSREQLIDALREIAISYTIIDGKAFVARQEKLNEYQPDLPPDYSGGWMNGRS